MDKLRVVSVDWDFFIYNAGEAKEGNDRIVIHPGTKQQQEVYGGLLFDWGCNERYGVALSEMLWMTRFSSILRLGCDPRRLVSIDPDRGCTTPDEFMSVISDRFGKSAVVYSDSHATAYRECAGLSDTFDRPCSLILFDAHSDLGYTSSDHLRREDREGVCQCGSWVWHALNRGHVGDVTIVYPDWRGLRDWESIRELFHVQEVSEKITVMTWSDFVSSDIGGVTAIRHFARSSAWTPPWLDDQFARLISHTGRPGICLDCRHETPSAFDACQPRIFDENKAREIAEVENHVMSVRLEEK